MEKIKLIYKFDEDITEKDIESFKKIGEVKDIVPTIFPPCGNFYFFSKSISKCFVEDWGKKIVELENLKFKIASIYDCCGIHPLFFVIKTNIGEDIAEILDNLHKGLNQRFNTSAISFTSSPRCVEKRLGICREEFQEDQKFLLEKRKDFLEKMERMIYEGYKEKVGSVDIKTHLFDEKQRIEKNFNEFFKNTSSTREEIFRNIRFIPIINVPILSIIFLKLPPKNAKNVLEKLKNTPHVIDIYKIVGNWDYALRVWLGDTQELYDFITILHKEGCETVTKCALRVWKEEFWVPGKPFLAKESYKSLGKIEEKILNILGRNEGRILFQSQEEKIKILQGEITGVPTDKLKELLTKVEDKIWKYSVKLDRPGWLQNIVFIKAALGKKEELKDFLREEFLGATQYTFARRDYHITGMFDFIILLDSMNLKKLKEELNKLEKKEKLIGDIRISTILPKPPNPEDDVKEGAPLEPAEAQLLNTLLPNAEGCDDKEIKLNLNTVRGKFYNYLLYRSLELENGKGFEEINKVMKLPEGTKFIPELDPHKMLHVFVRFKVSDKDEFEKKIIEKKKEFAFLKVYEPIHDPSSIMCILAAKDYNALFTFIKDLDVYCRLTEVSLIFHQGFPHRIPEEIRCKPCLFPKGTPCEACPQYIIEPKKGIFPPKNFEKLKEEEMQQCVKIAVIPIKISEDDLISLMKGNGKTEEYNQHIIKKLEEAIENGAEIIVFPELSIPNFTVEKIKESIPRIGKSRNKQSMLIVIAGSHYRSYRELLWNKQDKKFQEKEKFYNVSPILFYQNEEVIVYEQFKNNITSEEKKFFENLKNNGIFSQEAELGGGIGYLKFETKLGRIGILVCYDATDADLRFGLRNKIDILIVPSWQKVNEGTTNRYKQFAHEDMYWVVFANSGKMGGSRLFGPIKSAKTNEASESLKSAIEGSEEIKYLIVGNGVRRLQKGENNVEDDHYVYETPRPQSKSSYF